MSERDLLVAPAAQRALAATLGARVLSLDIGHMGLGTGAAAQVFGDALCETMEMGEVLARAAAAGGGVGSATAAAPLDAGSAPVTAIAAGRGGGSGIGRGRVGAALGAAFGAMAAIVQVCTK